MSKCDSLKLPFAPMASFFCATGGDCGLSMMQGDTKFARIERDHIWRAGLSDEEVWELFLVSGE